MPEDADDLDDLEGRRNRFESLDSDFEGLGPSNRTILGKRQPLFFTPREKLTQIRPYLGSRSARNTFSGPTWERKGRVCFLAIF